MSPEAIAVVAGVLGFSLGSISLLYVRFRFRRVEKVVHEHDQILEQIKEEVLKTEQEIENGRHE